MKIIIIGAGELGQLLAQRLSASEEHDVVLIDTAQSEFERVRDKLDVMTLVGKATDVSVMKKAGVEEADLLLAVSGDQASNMLACQVARHLGVRKTICRLYSLDGFSPDDGITPAFFGIGKAFSSPAECAKHVVDVLRRQTVLEQMEFSNPQATVIVVRIDAESPLCGLRLQDVPNPELLANIRFAALVRRRQLIFPHGDTMFEEDDRVYVAGNRKYVEEFLDFVEDAEADDKRLVIIGGATRLGELVAREALKLGRRVCVIEPEEARGEQFMGRMPADIRVITGSTTDDDVMKEAGISQCDTYVGAEDDDESSILSCLIAKRLGAGKVVSVTHKPEYINIVPEMAVIDSGFNSTVVSVNTVFRLMDEGVIRVDSHLQTCQAYLTEFKLLSTSRLAGVQVKDAQLPESVVLAMIFRDDNVLAPTGTTVLQTGDVVVAIVTPVSEELLKPYFV